MPSKASREREQRPQESFVAREKISNQTTKKHPQCNEQHSSEITEKEDYTPCGD